MNEKFLELPEEKQLRVINAAMEVFAKNEYKHAITDDIAFKAGISKGLLFYYFNNKKNLYLHVFHYTMDIMREQIWDAKFQEIDDFFELIEYASYKKCVIIEKNPYLMDFTMKCVFGDKENVPPELQNDITQEKATIYSVYFNNINLNKFRDDISPEYLLRMLTWMSEGYVLEKKMQGKELLIDEIMADYKQWSQYFRRIAYKEEYLNESN